MKTKNKQTSVKKEKSQPTKKKGRIQSKKKARKSGPAKDFDENANANCTVKSQNDGGLLLDETKSRLEILQNHGVLQMSQKYYNLKKSQLFDVTYEMHLAMSFKIVGLEATFAEEQKSPEIASED